MKVLITGGAGFIGTNLTLYLLKKKIEVIGCGWIEERRPLFIKNFDNYRFISMDVRNPEDYGLLPEVDVIIHLAANVGIQKGIIHPISDFETNSKSTVYLLEWARNHGKPLFIYASSNKVYPLNEWKSHTPYGVSKRTSELWCKEYNFTYNVPTIVNRQSCIYGPYQKGHVEEGWISWFMIANLKNLPLTIFGDGTQQRDVLYVGDLCKLIYKEITTKEMWGKVYNVGGGKKNVVSLREVMKIIESLSKKKYEKVSYKDVRLGDQKTYISDLTDLEPYWKPQVSMKEGFKKAYSWLYKNL